MYLGGTLYPGRDRMWHGPEHGGSAGHFTDITYSAQSRFSRRLGACWTNARMRTTPEKVRHIATLRHLMAQVADLQRQRGELDALRGGSEQTLEAAAQFAKVDSALRVARLSLAQILMSLPASERTRFIKVHGLPRSEGHRRSAAQAGADGTQRAEGSTAL